MTDLNPLWHRVKYETDSLNFINAVNVYKDAGWKIAYSGYERYVLSKKIKQGQKCIYKQYPDEPVIMEKLLEDPGEWVSKAEDSLK